MSCPIIKNYRGVWGVASWALAVQGRGSGPSREGECPGTSGEAPEGIPEESVLPHTGERVVGRPRKKAIQDGERAGTWGCAVERPGEEQWGVQWKDLQAIYGTVYKLVKRRRC